MYLWLLVWLESLGVVVSDRKMSDGSPILCTVGSLMWVGLCVCVCVCVCVGRGI